MAALSIRAATLNGDAESASKLRLVKPRARLLSVSADQEDHLVLHRLVDSSQWRLVTAETCRDAIRELWLNGARVVFCDCALPDGTWKDVVGRGAKLGDPPRFVVTSLAVNASLWSEVLKRGGCDVLAKPLIGRDVRRVLSSVWHELRPSRRPASSPSRAGSPHSAGRP
jgi:DNA-binding NtrC family response regulator